MKNSLADREFMYYVGDDGKEWIKYYVTDDFKYNGWICITEPCNKKIKVDDRRNYTIYLVKEPPLEKQPPNHVVISIILVIVVVGVTAVVIRCMFKKDETTLSDSMIEMEEKNKEDK